MQHDSFPRAPFAHAQEFLPAQYRGGDEDWNGERAFTFVRWVTPPVLGENGTVTTPGVPRDLAGCSARGLLYRRELFGRYPLGAPIQAPVALAGEIGDPLSGEFDLTLAQAAVMTLDVQNRYDALPRYLIRALLTDPSGREAWVGTVPVFVL